MYAKKESVHTTACVGEKESKREREQERERANELKRRLATKCIHTQGELKYSYSGNSMYS